MTDKIWHLAITSDDLPIGGGTSKEPLAAINAVMEKFGAAITHVVKQRRDSIQRIELQLYNIRNRQRNPDGNVGFFRAIFVGGPEASEI